MNIKKKYFKVLYKIGVLKNFAKFTGKHLYWILFFNKVTGLRHAALLKKRLRHMCFPVNFAKFLRTPFLQNTSRWLLLNIKENAFVLLILTFVTWTKSSNLFGTKYSGMDQVKFFKGCLPRFYLAHSWILGLV